MPNMSYCRFENTLGDLLDCEEYLTDDLTNGDEAKARKRLIACCQRIAADAKNNDLVADDEED